MHPFKRILVATDFSEKADNAIFRAAMLAKENHAKLILLHVAEKNIIDKIIVKLIPPATKILISPKEHAASLLKNKIKELKKLKIKVSSAITSGHPGASILTFAKKKKMDLIVMGARGHYGINDWFIGTTTEIVTKHAKVPVLVIKKQNKKPYHNVLIPIDFSTSNKTALSFALHNVPDATLRVIYSANYDDETYLKKHTLDKKKQQNIKKSIIASIKSKTEKFIRENNPTSTIIKHHVTLGYPSIEITKFANKTHTDLIIMGSSGHSHHHYVRLGRVATRVLYEVSADILLIPPTT